MLERSPPSSSIFRACRQRHDANLRKLKFLSKVAADIGAAIAEIETDGAAQIAEPEAPAPHQTGVRSVSISAPPIPCSDGSQRIPWYCPTRPPATAAFGRALWR